MSYRADSAELSGIVISHSAMASLPIPQPVPVRKPTTDIPQADLNASTQSKRGRQFYNDTPACCFAQFYGTALQCFCQGKYGNRTH